MTSIIIDIHNFYDNYREDAYPNVTMIRWGLLDGLGINNNFLKKFPNLRELNCSNRLITKLNITDHPNLQKLDCTNNEITTLNISNLPSLQKLDCAKNRITTLNISNLPSLQILNCSNNRLTTLNLIDFTSLQNLYVSENRITTLKFTNVPALQIFSCGNNQLTELDVTNFSNLQVLDCGCNELTYLNITDLRGLERLYCQGNHLTTLNITNLTALYDLSCSNNELITLNVTGLVALLGLYCENNPLTSICGIEKHHQLKRFCCDRQIRYNFTNLEILIIKQCNPVVFGIANYPKCIINSEISFFAVPGNRIDRFEIPEDIANELFQQYHNGILMKVYYPSNYPAIHARTFIDNQTRIMTVLSIRCFCDTILSVIPNELLFEIFLSQDPFDMFFQ